MIELGLYAVPTIDAATLFSVKDILIRLNLSLSKLHGQCYDGCSTMSDPKSGVAKRVSKMKKNVLYYSLLLSFFKPSC